MQRALREPGGGNASDRKGAIPLKPTSQPRRDLRNWAAPTRPFQVPQAANSDPQPEHAPEWKERTVGFP
jgi:hypothetical protein